MLYDKFFFVVWTFVLSIALLIFGFESVDISLNQSVRNQALVYFSSPSVSSFGVGVSIVQKSTRGLISDAGFSNFTLELMSPRPFTEVVVNGAVKRRFLHVGVFSTSFSEFYGSDTGYGILRYRDSLGNQNRIFVWFGYPDYDQSSHTMIYQFRAAIQDEIPIGQNFIAVKPEEISKGQIKNIDLQILTSNNG